jgi:hypothetical protein
LLYHRKDDNWFNNASLLTVYEKDIHIFSVLLILFNYAKGNRGRLASGRTNKKGPCKTKYRLHRMLQKTLVPGRSGEDPEANRQPLPSIKRKFVRI